MAGNGLEATDVTDLDITEATGRRLSRSAMSTHLRTAYTITVSSSVGSSVQATLDSRKREEVTGIIAGHMGLIGKDAEVSSAGLAAETSAAGILRLTWLEASIAFVLLSCHELHLFG